MAAGSLGLNDLQAQQRIVAWGDNSDGETNVPPFQCVSDIKAVAAGYYHCLALRSNGTVIAWGAENNSLGQTNVPPTLTNVMAIAAGNYHSLALRSNGTVTAWGANNVGQLNVPASLTNAIAIAAGGDHNIALRADGTVVAWGDGFLGETNVPPGLTGVKAISAGDVHCLVLKSNGTLLAWGDNASGQTNIPPGLTNIMAIAAGYHHNLALRSNGTVVAWELNVYGESTVPTNLSNVAAVAASDFFSMALKSNGTVVAWGQNFTGQTNIPAGLTNVTAIAAGYEGFCLALTTSRPPCPPGTPDDFACRGTLTGSNISFSVSNVSATQEPCEPIHFGFQDVGKSLWYTWTAPFTGGAVLSAASDFPTPCLAVYTGADFATFSPVASNNTAFFQSRIVFNATTGTTYQIALDGTSFGGSVGQGNFNVALNLTPPPANDLFANRTPIPGTFFQTSGSFIGATQEVAEPLHGGANGNPAFHQTLWWTWTAPTNLGVSSIPVRLIADAVSFPPNIGVYTGTSIPTLSAVTLSTQTNGMTRIASFSALPGTAYQIALGGQHYEPLGVDASPRYGDYRLRLNIRALVLSFAQIDQTNNGDTISFGANLQVTNFGSATSDPLRLLVTANSGISVLGQDSGFMTNAQIVLLVTNFAALTPGQGVVRRFIGTVPAPTVNSGVTLGVGYGAYGQLQEQVVTNWITLDQSLILFGNWPDLNGNAGPGGGVIRLDPGLTGATFNPLTNVSILGLPTIPEGTVAGYSGRARYSDGYQIDFTNTVWNSTLFTITTNGVFTTGIVTSNTTVTLDAKYSSGGFLYDVTTNIVILDLPPPKLSQIQVANSNVTLSVQGVPNRKLVLEAANSLSTPIPWLPVSTNVLDANGLGIFMQPVGTNRTRFFRARESD